MHGENLKLEATAPITQLSPDAIITITWIKNIICDGDIFFMVHTTAVH